jgi:cytoskeletal protein CcmA (bactofilin family)
MLAVTTIVVLLSAAGLAAAPESETKSTTAQPVTPATPPAPPDAPDVPDLPDRPDVPDRPGVLDQGRNNETSGVGQDINVPAGTTHDGDISCVYGHVTIDGHVNGDVTVVAGRLDLNGSVDGDVTGVASRMDLDPKAKVDGDVTNVAGTLRRNGATVQGQVVNMPFGITPPSWSHGFGRGWGDFIGFFFWWRVFAVFLFFVCALLLSALVPERIRLISEEAPARLFTAFVFGLVGYVVLVFVQLFLTITLIGIPLVFLLYLVFVVLKWMAMCGIFHQIGARLGRAIGRELSLLGAILVGFLPFALLRFVPLCVGFSIWFLVEILGFGYLILTRVGTRGTPSAAPQSAQPSGPATTPEALPT